MQKLHERLHLHAPYHADLLNNDRGVAVWLPSSYHDNSEQRFPVLYLQDGLTCLDSDPRSGDLKAGVDTWVKKLSAEGQMQEIILVAVDSLSNRDQEYSPAVMGEAYADLLIRQIKPLIDWEYRTRPEPENTGVAGWSLGGLISLYLRWKHSDVFGKAACLSTCYFDCSTDSDEDNHLSTYHQMLKSDWSGSPGKLYMDQGTDEERDGGASQFNQPELDKNLLAHLKQSGWRRGIDFCFHSETGGRHLLEDWRKRFHRPLGFLFNATNF